MSLPEATDGLSDGDEVILRAVIGSEGVIGVVVMPAAGEELIFGGIPGVVFTPEAHTVTMRKYKQKVTRIVDLTIPFGNCMIHF